VNPLLVKALAALLVGGASAGATWIATEPIMGAAAPEPHAWIDEPLDQAVLPPDEDVTITAHATDADGVDLVELRVDGDLEETVTADGGSLVMVEIAWTPPSEGTFLLEVRGRPKGGPLGAPGSATVFVGEVEDAATTTTTVADGSTTTTGSTTSSSLGDTTTSATSSTVPGQPTTTRPTGTTQTTRPPTTTTTTCGSVAPTLVNPPDGSSLRSSPTLTWSYSGCPVGGFRVEVRVAPEGVPTMTQNLPPSARSWGPPDGFTCNGRPYYWRVGAIDGRTFRWSPQWSFSCG
jgi:hypothetical protein